METSPMVKPTLAIVLLTFRRPAPLADLIPLLIEQARAVSNEAAGPINPSCRQRPRAICRNPLVAQFADQGSSTPMNLSPASYSHETVQ